ncbi:hypothetical protein ACNRWW_04625 [Metabacillus sp. HB246100]|uniref:hypothetical protein n=1 Tax=Bacillus weihaiensis TaxID=1547283 RepID=UPI002356B6C6|nr:hypothetical protein [Bacillus weihaiensis]
MQLQQELSKNVEIVTKREWNVKRVLTIYGLFTVFALVISIFTVPISISENLQLFYNEELLLKFYKIKEFLLFIFGSAFLFFFLVTIYAKGKRWNNVFYVTLILLFGFSLFMFSHLIFHSTPH